MNNIRLTNERDFSRMILIGGKDVRLLEPQLALLSGLVKQCTGVTNFIAYYTMLDAIDHMKKHPAYKQATKKAFRKAMDMYFDYEKNLRFSKAPRFFCVNDIPKKQREMYKKDFTDSEYFEMWRDVGASSYSKYSKELKVLYWKYHRSLSENKVEHAGILSYVLIADASLMLSVKFFASLMGQISGALSVPFDRVCNLYKLFSLEEVYEAWEQAIVLLNKTVKADYEVSPSDDRNILLGLRQFEKAVTDDLLKMDGLREAMELNRDKFANKNEFRLAINDLNKKAATDQEIEDIYKQLKRGKRTPIRWKSCKGRRPMRKK